MKTCDADTAMFMSKALLNHAREIHRYAKAYSEPILVPGSSAEAADRQTAKFTRNIERLLAGMDSLMLMAKHKGVSRFCNQEQIDAYIEEARAAIAPKYAMVKQTAPELN